MQTLSPSFDNGDTSTSEFLTNLHGTWRRSASMDTTASTIGPPVATVSSTE